MKYLYIVVDLATLEVVLQSDTFDSCLAYERENQEKALYCVELGVDKLYPCSRSLKGVAL